MSSSSELPLVRLDTRHDYASKDGRPRKFIFNQKKMVVDAAEQDCLAQSQSKSVLQGVQMDKGDVLPSSEIKLHSF